MEKAEELKYFCTTGSRQSLKAPQSKHHLSQGLKHGLEFVCWRMGVEYGHLNRKNIVKTCTKLHKFRLCLGNIGVQDAGVKKSREAGYEGKQGKHLFLKAEGNVSLLWL